MFSEINNPTVTNINEQSLAYARFYCTDVFPGDYGFTLLNAAKLTLEHLPVQDPYSELPQPIKEFEPYIQPAPGEVPDFYTHFVNPVAQVIASTPPVAKSLYLREYLNQFEHVQIGDLVAKCGQVPLGSKEINLVRLHARLTMQIAIADRTSLDRRKKYPEPLLILLLLVTAGLKKRLMR